MSNFNDEEIGKKTKLCFFFPRQRKLGKNGAESVTRSCFKDVSTVTLSLRGRRKVRRELREKYVKEGSVTDNSCTLAAVAWD